MGTFLFRTAVMTVVSWMSLPVWAASITMGETQDFTNGDSGNAGVVIAQSANLSQSATITSFSIEIAKVGGSLQLGLYDASGANGGPGKLLASSKSFTPVSGWNKNIAVKNQVSLKAGKYWLAYLPTNNNLTTLQSTTSSSSGVYYAYGSTTLPATFPAKPSKVAYHWSFYANLNASNPVPPPQPSPTPVPTPQPVPSAFQLGQVPFAATSSWNTPIPPSTVYTNVAWPASTGYNYTVSWDAYSAAIFVAAPTDPLVNVTYPAGWGYPGGTLQIHMPANADGAPGTDGELLIVDGTKVHNFWIFKRTSLTTATAQSYGVSDVLTGTGWGSKSPFLGAGITAAGSSQMAGILVQAETDAGEIRHALNIRGDASIVAAGAVGFAISSDGSASGGILREGQRYAIPPSTVMPSGLSPLGQKVFRALQNYGAYVTDVSGGCTTIGAQQNAYDNATITKLWHDTNSIIPLLKSVSVP